jgi:SPX domain protein involved in polyphosphate accumulation
MTSENSIIKLLYTIHTELDEKREDSWVFLKEVLDGLIGAGTASKEFCKYLVSMTTKNSSKILEVEQLEKVIKEVLVWIVSAILSSLFKSVFNN